MNCPNCGQPLLPDARFCGNCGTRIPAAPVDAAQPPMANSVPPQQPYSQPLQQPYAQPTQPQQPYSQPLQQPYAQPTQPQQPAQPPYGYAQQPVQPPYGQPVYVQSALLAREQFDQHPLVQKYCKNIRVSAIVMYVCAGITLLANVVAAQNIAGLLDVAILVGLGLGVHLARSRVCAYITLAYGVFNLIYMLVEYHIPGGYLVILGAVCAVGATSQYWKAWKNYQQTGQFPVGKQ